MQEIDDEERRRFANSGFTVSRRSSSAFETSLLATEAERRIKNALKNERGLFLISNPIIKSIFLHTSSLPLARTYASFPSHFLCTPSLAHHSKHCASHKRTDRVHRMRE